MPLSLSAYPDIKKNACMRVCVCGVGASNAAGGRTVWPSQGAPGHVNEPYYAAFAGNFTVIELCDIARRPLQFAHHFPPTRNHLRKSAGCCRIQCSQNFRSENALQTEKGYVFKCCCCFFRRIEREEEMGHALFMCIPDPAEKFGWQAVNYAVSQEIAKKK